MDKQTALRRFAFLAEAFDGSGGFAPAVSWETEQLQTKTQAGEVITASRRVPKTSGPNHLTPYQRESVEKFAGRSSLAVYENHLREACERFVGFLGRKKPQREGTNAPLVQLLVKDADLKGTPLDEFLTTFALKAKARGSMLLLVDLPAIERQEEGKEGEAGAMSLRQQIDTRAVPFLRAIEPETVVDFEVDDDTGLFEWVEIRAVEEIAGKAEKCVRRWDAEKWQVIHEGKVVEEGEHKFGKCPVLAFTENGDAFPVVGKFAQIADLSRDIFNLDSELRELLRSQTFSILTMQVPPESAGLFDPMATAASIGTHSMLIHQGITPAFVSPDSGPAEVYMKKIEQRQASIKRIAMEDASSDQGGANESGVARKLRFERLNADLATFAGRMRSLEAQVWGLFHSALGTENRVVTVWPTDFNLTDTVAELDILASMQGCAFPTEVIAAKQAAIVDAEFDAMPDAERAALKAAVNEQAQEPKAPGNAPGATDHNNPSQD